MSKKSGMGELMLCLLFIIGFIFFYVVFGVVSYV